MKTTSFRYSSLLVLLSLFSCSLLAQVTQKGKVLQCNEKNERLPISGVTIKVAGAGSTVSDGQGNFILNFLSHKKGDAVTSVNISKTGYEILNKNTVEQWNINPDRPFSIVLCQSKLIKEIADIYYATSSLNYKKQMQREKESLSKELKNREVKEAEYLKRISELEDYYATLMSSTRTIAQELAHIDIDELPDFEQNAIAYVKKGDFEQGLSVYEKTNLSNSYQDHLVDIPTLERYFLICKLSGSSKNLQKIELLLSEIFSIDSTNDKIGSMLANRYNELGKYKEAEKVSKTILRIKEKENDYYELAQIQHNMGTILLNNNDNDGYDYYYKAESSYKNALESNENRRNAINLKYIELLINRGYRYQGELQQDLALADYSKSLQIINGLTSIDTIECAKTYCSLFNNIGQYYVQSSNYKAAENNFTKALFWASKINSTEDSLYYLLEIEKSKSQLFLRSGKYHKGGKAQQQALDACEQLYKYDPDNYQMEYARRLRDYGWTESLMENATEAIQYLNKSIEVFDSIEKKFPTKTDHGKGMALYYLGSIYSDIDNTISKKYMEKSLYYLERYFKYDSTSAIEALSIVEGDLGASYYMDGQITKGIDLLEKSAQHMKVIYQTNPAFYQDKYTKIHLILLVYYVQNGMNEKGAREYKLLQGIAPDNYLIRNFGPYFGN